MSRTGLQRLPGNVLDQIRALTQRMNRVERVIQIKNNAGLTGVIEQSFLVSAIADNVATTVFKILTKNESGSNDGGGYSCKVEAVILHAGGSADTIAAVKSFEAHFGRVMIGGGTGVSTAVSEISETASAATSAISRDIGTVTMTTTEISEYEVDVKLTIDLTGSTVSTGNVVLFVRLVYYGFLTAPVMVAV